MKFDFYSDPGHGWVKVTRKLLVKLGIEDKVTPYSYQRGDYAYLEEDCDLSILWNALEALGDKPEFRYHTADRSSKIRRYESFQPTTGAPSENPTP